LSSELPEKCRQCAKSTVSSVHNNCKFCRDIEFQEEVLCYLNRCIQEPADFKCHAFQPLLKLVDSSGTKQRALALQKLNSDPEGVFMDIRYHFAWNVTHRAPVLDLDNDIFDFLNGAFSNCNELVGGL